MKKKHIILTTAVIILLVAGAIYYWLNSDHLTEDQLAVKRMRDIHQALCIYKDTYGDFPPALKNLESTHILYEQIDYSNYMKNVRYIYWDNKKNLSYDFTRAQGYSSPEPQHMKVWFYYPLNDGKAVVGFGPTVTVGVLKKAPEGKSRVKQEESYPSWHLDRTATLEALKTAVVQYLKASSDSKLHQAAERLMKGTKFGQLRDPEGISDEVTDKQGRIQSYTCDFEDGYLVIDFASKQLTLCISKKAGDKYHAGFEYNKATKKWELNNFTSLPHLITYE